MSQRSILSFVKGGKTVAKSTSAAGRGPAKSAGVKRAASDGTSASDTSPNKRTATGEGEAAAQLSPEQMERMEKNKMQVSEPRRVCRLSRCLPGASEAPGLVHPLLPPHPASHRLL